MVRGHFRTDTDKKSRNEEFLGSDSESFLSLSLYSCHACRSGEGRSF